MHNRLLTVFGPPRLPVVPFESCDHIDKVISIRFATHIVDPYVDAPNR